MKKNKHNISLFVVSVLLGAMLTVQFSTVHRPRVEDDTPVADNLQLTTELAQERERKHFLENQIVQHENQIRIYESKHNDREGLAKELEEELDKMKLLAGVKEITGNGLIVTVEDAPDLFSLYGSSYEPMLLGELLYQLVNTLNANGAQALAVENHRIVSFSSIRTISANQTQVNRIEIDPTKITIRAVGDIEQMKIGINRFKPSFAQYLAKDFKVQEVTNGSLKIPPYQKAVEFIYADPEGGDN